MQVCVHVDICEVGDKWGAWSLHDTQVKFGAKVFCLFQRWKASYYNNILNAYVTKASYITTSCTFGIKSEGKLHLGARIHIGILKK